MPKSSLARPHARTPLTPEALETLERVARTGSFAGAARELGKVPSALTYSMRALEEALDVLLFDRSSRQARLTPAGEELLREGQRLLRELDALTKRVKRVATGWESGITIAVDGIIDASALLELVRDFYRLDSPTRVTVREEILGGTWEALASGAADIAIGITQEHLRPPGIEVRRLGSVPFLFVMSATHPLAGSDTPLGEEELIGIRAIAVADSSRDSTPLTRNLLPGQQVLTLPSARLKLQAIEAGLGCGWLPEPMVRSRLREGWLHARPVAGRAPSAEFDYAWRSDPAGFGRARRWWVEQLARSEVQRNFLTCSSTPS